MKQKLLIIDDDPYSIQGVTALLSEHYDVFGAFTVNEMEKLFKKHTFVLVILDLDLKKGGHGLDLIESIKAQGCKVLVLTNAFDQESILGCLRAQVNGFVPKQEKTEQLLTKVQGAIAGHYMTDPALIAEMARKDNRLPKFGWRERQLLDLIYADPFATSLQYAIKMNLAEGTVNNMFARLYAKLDVHQKAQLVAEVKRRGFRPREVELAGMAVE